MAEEVKSVSFKRLQSDENELQYYGCSSTQWIMDFHEILPQLIKDAFNEIHGRLKHKLMNRLSDQTSTELKDNMEKLQIMMIQNADRTLKQIVEPRIRNFFSVPEHALENDSLKCNPAERNIHALNDDISHLEIAFKKKKMFNAICETELSMIKSATQHNNIDPTLDGLNFRINFPRTFVDVVNEFNGVKADLKLGDQEYNGLFLTFN